MDYATLATINKILVFLNLNNFQVKVAENLVYGAHDLPNYMRGNYSRKLARTRGVRKSYYRSSNEPGSFCLSSAKYSNLRLII